MARQLKLTTITPKFVADRLALLRGEMQGRNERMDKYERMIRLDMYDDPPADGEVRVALPTAFDTVEKLRSMLMTRPPSLSVPTTSQAPDDQARAQKIERYLYGVMSRVNLRRHLADTEWNAVGLGEGVFKLHYDQFSFEDDFPLSIVVCDPRSIYGRMNPTKERFAEVAHTWRRTRREIEAEWDFEFRLPSVEMSDDLIQAWLDMEVDYIEYWTEVAEMETREPEPPEPKMMADHLQEAMMAGLESQAGMGPGEADMAMMDENATEGQEHKKPRRVRVRRIIHAVVVVENDPFNPGAGGTFIKKPTRMPGYTRIPYTKWAGISTPMAGRNASLSVLFPMANGDAGNKSYGVLAAQQWLASIDVQTGIKSPSAPLIISGRAPILDMGADAQNQVDENTKVGRIPMDSTNPAVLRSLDLMEKQVMRVAVPEVLGGQVYDLSGQAISGLATVFMMMLGFKQVERERALEDFFQQVLSLTKEYADPEDGWTAWGYGSNGKYVETTVTPADIGTNYRVQVKLSASMPKDENGEIAMLNGLFKDSAISWETFLDQFQKLKGLAAESPNDEMARVLRDKFMREGKLAEVISTLLGKEYVRQMVDEGLVSPEAEAQADALLAEMTAPPQPPPGAMGPPQGGPPGMAPPGMGGPPGMPPPGMGGPPMPPQPPGAPQIPPEMLAQLIAQGGPGGPGPMQAPPGGM